MGRGRAAPWAVVSLAGGASGVVNAGAAALVGRARAIVRNAIGDVGAIALSGVLAAATGLAKLNLGNNQISPAAEADLKAAKTPELRITFAARAGEAVSPSSHSK
jgi:hypothetical protein